jgi:hypothetical protein
MPTEYAFRKISKQDQVCYKCGFDIARAVIEPTGYDEDGKPQFWGIQQEQNAFRWESRGGYGALWGDDCRQVLVLCEACANELLGPYVKTRDLMMTADEHHAPRRALRNAADIQARWDARRLWRATKAAEPTAKPPTRL